MAFNTNISIVYHPSIWWLWWVEWECLPWTHIFEPLLLTCCNCLERFRRCSLVGKVLEALLRVWRLLPLAVLLSDCSSGCELSACCCSLHACLLPCFPTMTVVDVCPSGTTSSDELSLLYIALVMVYHSNGKHCQSSGIYKYKTNNFKSFRKVIAYTHKRSSILNMQFYKSYKQGIKYLLFIINLPSCFLTDNISHPTLDNFWLVSINITLAFLNFHIEWYHLELLII